MFFSRVLAATGAETAPITQHDINNILNITYSPTH
jgi:hypothetical protein